MPRATSERLALSLRLCASQLGPARGQRPKPAALPSAAAWSSSPLQSGPSCWGLRGHPGEGMGQMPGVLAPKRHPEGVPIPGAPIVLASQNSLALPRDRWQSCHMPAKEPGSSRDHTGTGEGFQKHLCEIAATGKATTSVEGAGGGRRLQAARLRGHMG